MEKIFLRARLHYIFDIKCGPGGGAAGAANGPQAGSLKSK